MSSILNLNNLLTANPTLNLYIYYKVSAGGACAVHMSFIDSPNRAKSLLGLVTFIFFKIFSIEGVGNVDFGDNKLLLPVGVVSSS